MDKFEDVPINVKASLTAVAIKLNAVISTLNEEQLERYNQKIEIDKNNAADALKGVLSSEDIAEFLRILSL